MELGKEDEGFISEKNCMVDDEYLKHADEVLHYDDEEDNHVGWE